VTLALLQALYCAAITLVFVRGSVFDWLRARGPGWWRELVSCALCSGFWVGAANYTLETAYFADFSGWFWFAALKSGALAAAASLLLVRVLDALESAAEEK
jgi:hypothetical protein